MFRSYKTIIRCATTQKALIFELCVVSNYSFLPCNKKIVTLMEQVKQDDEINKLN
jgi:hypothetical protein